MKSIPAYKYTIRSPWQDPILAKFLAKSRMRDCWFLIEDGGSGEDGGEGAQDEGEVAEQGAPGKEGRSRARSRASLSGRTRAR